MYFFYQNEDISDRNEWNAVEDREVGEKKEESGGCWYEEEIMRCVQWLQWMA